MNHHKTDFLTILYNPSLHNARGFNCGLEKYNIYIQKIANQHRKRYLCNPFVYLNGLDVAAYYTLTNSSVLLEELPESIRNQFRFKVVPVTLLGMLAVDSSFRGKGLGRLMIMDAMHRAWYSAQIGPSSGLLILKAEPDLVPYYARFGFRPTATGNGMMFCTMAALAAQFGAAGLT
jgi:GNAT superfamily N-acetyltransferase